MTRLGVLALGLVAAVGLCAADDDLVFRSDVSLVRVDAQVVDRNNRAITGLEKEDFVLLQNGQRQEIRHFESEDTPVDVVLLLDVSGSMQAHIQRLSAASHQALQVLGERDRVAIMVFDRASRLRMPFRSNRGTIEREIEAVLNQEGFDGGTDVTQGLLNAANYAAREGRREARRAVVVLTDDQTERGRDEEGVLRTLSRGDVVMSALIAPDAMRGRYGRGGGNWPSGGGTWPSGGSGGGGWPGGAGGGWPGGIILGRRGPYGTGGGGVPGVSFPRTQSAGTSEIATRSGGDSMSVDDAQALEMTLMRLRQRYALHYNLPPGAQINQDRIEVELADAARRRYAGSEVRFRRVNAATETSEPVMISRTPTSSRDVTRDAPRDAPREDNSQLRRRRPAVNEDDSRVGSSQPGPTGGWRRSDQPEPEAAAGPPAAQPPAATAPPLTPEPKASEPQKGGWRRVKPGEVP